MAGIDREENNQLLSRIEQCIRTSGFDENFIKACMFHLQNVSPQFDPSKIEDQEKYIEILMSNFFFNKMEYYPKERFQCKVNECTAWPIPLLPPEVFPSNLISVEARKLMFYRCLRPGDYLECRVSSNLPTEYQLTVIHKYGVTRMLHDLNIIVTMRKADIKEKEFQPTALVRVVVTELEKDEETKVFVSVLDNNENLRSFRPQLGTIPDTHVPKYELNPPVFEGPTSYIKYLTSNRGFNHPTLLNEIYEGFGLDPRGVYTYFPTNESLNTTDVIAELKELKLSESNDFKAIALRDLENGAFSFALDAINLALKAYPKAVNKDEKQELSKLHQIKATILASVTKPKMNKKMIEEVLKAVDIDCSNQAALVELSKFLTRAAVRFLLRKKYSKAAEYASKALNLNEENKTAYDLKKYLEKKHPGETDDCNEISLQALLEKKKKLGSELKKLCREEVVPLVPY